MAIVEDLRTGIEFNVPRDMVRDYIGDPLYAVRLKDPQLRTDGRHVETITGFRPTPQEHTKAVREAKKAESEQRRKRTSPGFTTNVTPLRSSRLVLAARGA